jgi:hypothetical protein
VISYGIQPIAVTSAEIRPQAGNKRLELPYLSWQGCSIEPVRSERLAFHNVWFVDCFLVGTIFDRCDFYGGGFIRCALDGTLFRNCGFYVSEDAEAPRFEGCDSSSIAIVGTTVEGSTIQDLEFRDCELRQPTIDMTILVKEVRFTQGSRVAQGYFNVTPRDEAEVYVRFEEGTRAFHCSASQARQGYLRVPDDELRDNRSLPNRFWTRGQ